MKLSPKFAVRAVKLVMGSAALFASAISWNAPAQAPYVLPYTIQKLAGGGTPLALTAPATAPCLGSSVTSLTYDNYGDGCQITSTSVVVGAGQTLGNVHDIGVDPQGNVFFVDINSNSKSSVRRIDARSGVVTVVAGLLSTATQSICGASGSLASYGTPVTSEGDGCLASDGLANALGLHTSLSTIRGMTVARNGDVYLADYQTSLVHKISASTGFMTVVAGLINGTGKSGTGTAGISGNGGLATSAEVHSPRGVAVDTAGNIYIADTGNNEIRMVTAATGIINVIAGSPTIVAGSTGDFGPATSALISAPEDVEVDASGDVYIADAGNARIRLVYEGGASAAKLISVTNPGTVPIVGDIYTVVGGGAGAYTSTSYVLATSVSAGGDRKIAIDTLGNIYDSDSNNNVISFIDASTGYIHVIAGAVGATTGAAGCAAKTDSFGDNCPGTSATLSANSALSVATDSNGNIYIGDSGDDLVRKVTTGRDFPAAAFGASVTQTIDIHFAAADGPAALNPFVASGNGDFKLGAPVCKVNADTTQDCLLPVTFTPTVPGQDIAGITVTSTLNGSSVIGVGGAGIAPTVALDPGTLTSLATGFKAPHGIAQDSAGNTYVADTGNNRVLRYTAGGVMTVAAGTGTSGYSGDGALATAATLNAPAAVAVTPGGILYIADTGNNVIRRVSPATGFIATVGGGATTVCGLARDAQGDGCPGTLAKFSKPAGLVADSDENVYVSDTGNNLIRELSPAGVVSLIGGGASAVCSSTTLKIDSFGDNCNPISAIFTGPTGLALDSSHNLYIADTGDNEIRKIVAATDLVTQFAGTGVGGAGSNGGTATSAQVNAPTGVAVDAAGNVYIADTGNSAVRLVSSLGTINSVIGTIGTSGAGALPGSALTTALNSPTGIVATGNGGLIVLDGGNNRALTDSRGSVSYNFGRTNIGFSSPAMQIQETETGSLAATLGSPLFAASGSSAYFTVTGSGTNGCASGTNLSIGGSCLLSAVFSPTSAILNQSVSATYTESNTNTVNSPTPFINVSGMAAILTQTSSAVALTTPGVPQYAVPFSVTTTVTAVACNTSAPACYPTGFVTISVDGSPVGSAALGTGTGESAPATLSIASPLTVGTHTITAVYQGDSYYASDTSSAFTVTIAPETTTSVASASPNPVAQFSPLTLVGTISAFSGKPTGSFTFYAGSTYLGTAGVTATTGVATLSDAIIPVSGTTPAYNNNFGLAAGSYTITVVYSGDANYSPSTSTGYTLVIQPLPQSLTATLLNPSSGGVTSVASTQQGATTELDLFITPSNTLNGKVTFSCSGSPADSNCGFSPTTLVFAPSALAATPQFTQVTFWTDINPAVISASSLVGWPLFLLSLVAFLGLRRRARTIKPLLLIALFGTLIGSSFILTGCGNSGRNAVYLTPTGTYTINVSATGPNGQTITLPVTFTVAPGLPGQE